MPINVIKRCPEQGLIDSEENWHVLASAPNFTVCSRCLVDQVVNSPFASQFIPAPALANTSQACQFNRPRVLSSFQESVNSSSFEVFQSYVARRLQIPSCKGGGEAVHDADNFQWYLPKDPALFGQFCVCAECYDDYISQSSLSEHMKDAPIPQTGGQAWGCDLGWALCRKIALGNEPWNNLIGWAAYRNNLPVCGKGGGVDGTSRKWLKLRDPSFDSLWACEACYYDIVSRKPLESHFHPNAVLGPNAKLVCFISGNVALRVALDAAIQRQDPNIFLRSAQTFVRSPPCSAQGIQNGVWYSLIPACNEIDICAACYICIFESMEIGHLLAPKQVNPGEARLCNFNIAAPHMQALCSRLDTAISKGKDALFVDFVRRIANIPLCPGQKPVTNRRWYAHDVFTCCPACWLTAPIEGTKLATCFSSEVEASNQLKCDFYSLRVRALWKEACNNNDLDGFVAFMKKRLDIWSQTYPAIQQQLAIMKMNAQRQQTLYMASILNTGGNNIAAAAGAHGNFGNNMIGYGYETYAGAQGAAQFNQALGMSGSNLGAVGNITQLEMMWKSVE